MGGGLKRGASACLGVTELVVIVVQGNGFAHFASGDAGINETLGNSSGGENSVSRWGQVSYPSSGFFRAQCHSRHWGGGLSGIPLTGIWWARGLMLYVYAQLNAIANYPTV